MKTHEEIIKERNRLIEALEHLESEQFDYQHAWNKRLHSYRRQRRMLLEDIQSLNQLSWDFESG